jgi:hypothetical protein
MSWKGNLRTGVAIVRRIERAEKRRASNVARQYREIQKQEAFENGQQIVEEYNNYINLISSTHKESSEKIDWHEILKESEPSKPILENERETKAINNLSNYRPSFFAKILGTEKKTIRKLEQLVTNSKQLDIQEYEKNLKQYSDILKEWNLNQQFAKGVLSFDTESYSKVIKYLDPFSDIDDLGSGLKIDFEKEYAEITLFANGTTVIPDFILSQTATGKVSKKKMPIGKFYELYQDYICSSVLRIARECFSFLPINYVFVNVESELINTVNGQLEKQNILSVAIPVLTLEKLNFETIDPSDSMRNFIHKMKFSKTAGFNIVEKVLPNEIEMNMRLGSS